MEHQERQQHGEMMRMPWGMFGALIAASTIAMFFRMYQLIYRWDHATFSMNRLLSSFVAGMVMALIMGTRAEGSRAHYAASDVEGRHRAFGALHVNE